MAERAVFLDRDNTIIEDKEGYIGDPAKVKLMPGAATAIASMRRLGYRIIVVSNQSGVARGMFDEAAVESVNQEMCRQLRDQGGAHVDASYYCPYHPDGTVPEYKMEHDWRKPKPGMLKQAAEDFGLDLNQCWVLGDALRDVECGLAVRCRTILVQDPSRPPRADEVDSTTTPHFIVKTLADAARVIAREGRASHRETPKVVETKPSETKPAEPAVVPAVTPAEPAVAEAAQTEVKTEPVSQPVETAPEAPAEVAKVEATPEIKPALDPEPLAPKAESASDPISQAEAPTETVKTTEAVEEAEVTKDEKSALIDKPIEVAVESKAEESKPAPVAVPTPAEEPDPAQLVSRPRPQPHPALLAATAPTGAEPRSESANSVNSPRHDGLKPVVDEILSLLRQRHRAQEMPEFTLSRFLALLAQIGVFVCFIMAIWDGVASMPGQSKEWAQQSLLLYRGIMWMLGSVTLQVMVVTLNHNQRQR